MAPRDAPGPLIGAGRAADVFDIGDGRVLRRNRNGASTAVEASVMEYLHAQGYPVPEVYESDGADLIMERLVGPTMLDAFPRRPWRLNQWAAMLAELHTRLEAVPVPSLDLPARSGPPQVLIHADLHPDNVMITDAGPIVIDWPNASIGPRGFDVASTWVLVTTSALEGSRILRAMQSTARTHFVKRFLADCDQKLARSLLPAAAQHRLEDRHLRPGEAEAIQALLADEAHDSPR